jgi:hypothetical protein
MHPTRLFKTTEFSKIEAKEWTKTHFVGREGNRVTEELKVPLTFEGFKIYCREHYGEVEQYFTNQGEYYDDFVGVCRAIKEEIRDNQIKGGLLGLYNPSITQRLNNLTEKTEVVKSKGKLPKWMKQK